MMSALGAYIRVTVVSDFSQDSLAEAARHLGCLPRHMTVYVNPGYAPEAQLAMDRFRCKIVLFPPDLIKDGWAVNYKDQWVWSPGVS